MVKYHQPEHGKINITKQDFNISLSTNIEFEKQAKIAISNCKRDL